MEAGCTRASGVVVGGSDSDAPAKAQSRRSKGPPVLGRRGGCGSGWLVLVTGRGAGRRRRMSMKLLAGLVRTRVEVFSLVVSLSCGRG